MYSTRYRASLIGAETIDKAGDKNRTCCGIYKEEIFNHVNETHWVMLLTKKISL